MKKVIFTSLLTVRALREAFCYEYIKNIWRRIWNNAPKDAGKNLSSRLTQ